jgi:hypothetical protein
MIFKVSISPASTAVFQVFSPHIVMAQGVKGLRSAAFNPLRSLYQANRVNSKLVVPVAPFPVILKSISASHSPLLAGGSYINN